MGIDASIMVKVADGLIPGVGMDCDFVVVPDKPGWYAVESPWSFRFYGKEYQRGHWPRIAAILLELLADSSIEEVRYSGDCGEYDEGPVTVEFINDMNKFYVENGRA